MGAAAAVVVAGRLTDLAAWALSDCDPEQRHAITVPGDALGRLVDRLVSLGVEVEEVRPVDGLDR